MTTTVNTTRLTFPHLTCHPRQAEHLRGHFARAFGKDSVLFHNHTPEGGFRYQYSLVQYKVAGRTPMVLGVGDGADLVMQAFMNVNEIDLNGQRVRVDEKELSVDRAEVGIIEDLREYRLASPLFMFNKFNYEKFRGLSEAEQPTFLKYLLRSHLKTTLLGLGCEGITEQKILVSPRLEKRMVPYNNVPMQMYRGGFTANVALPEWVGIGKSTSKGFGAVVRSR